jgi:hypothetical protein
MIPFIWVSNITLDSHCLLSLDYDPSQAMLSDPDWEKVNSARQLKRDEKMVSDPVGKY